MKWTRRKHLGLRLTSYVKLAVDATAARGGFREAAVFLLDNLLGKGRLPGSGGFSAR
jgi:hypothetical protein